MDVFFQVQQEFRAQQNQFEKMEAIYKQKIGMMQEEVNELNERQEGMKRINSKLMKIFDKKSTRSSKNASKKIEQDELQQNNTFSQAQV